MESTIRLFVDDCVIYRNINNADVEKLQKYLDRLRGVGGWKCDENKSK